MCIISYYTIKDIFCKRDTDESYLICSYEIKRYKEDIYSFKTSLILSPSCITFLSSSSRHRGHLHPFRPNHHRSGCRNYGVLHRQLQS